MAFSRREFIKKVGSSVLLASSFAGCSGSLSKKGISKKRPDRPNIIIILGDDGPGYGDLGCYGSQIHNTPHIDRMASEGVKFTDFYQAAPSCTPSRASLLTGCYARRIGMHEGAEGTGTLWPGDAKGLNPSEVTLADILRKAGYATACIGKWHLGDHPEFLPTRQGFGYYFGLPYSNDMTPSLHPEQGWPPLPLMKNEKVIETEPDQAFLTQRYTEETCAFIRKNKDNNFFLYLAHSMVHVPLHASDKFRGRSKNGIYGDALEEMDWSVGKIFEQLKQEGIDDKTLVIFMSDDGASRKATGSNSPLSGFKGDTLEGGMRSPCILRWPGHIRPKLIYKGISTIMDILPTCAHLVEMELALTNEIDGKNLWPFIHTHNSKTSPHNVFYYYMKGQLQAVRSGKWKLHLPLSDKIEAPWPTAGRSRVDMKLIDLDNDIRETTNLSERYPKIVARLMDFAEEARAAIGDELHNGSGYRQPGYSSSLGFLEV